MSATVSQEKCPICEEELELKDTVKITQKGAKGINEASTQRGVDIFVSAGTEVHKECRQMHVNKKDIELSLKRKRGERTDCVGRRPSRASVGTFDSKSDCLYCGCQVSVDERDSFSRVSTDNFVDSVLAACATRTDPWALTVRARVEYFAHDLHAPECVYHHTCDSNFRTERNIPQMYDPEPSAKRKKAGRPKNEDQEQAFILVCAYLESNDEEQLTVSDLSSKMKDYLENEEAVAFDNYYLKRKLKEHYKDSISFAEKEGQPDIVTMKEKTKQILRSYFNQSKAADEESQKRAIIETAARLIKSDIKTNVPSVTDSYPSVAELGLEPSLQFIPDSLRLLLHSLFVGDSSKKVASVGQSIIQAVRPRAVVAPLQIALSLQMHHLYRSKFLVDTLSAMGFCSSYSEVLRFEKNAADAIAPDIFGTDINPQDSMLLFAADNVDHNLITIDGKGTFHGMGMVAALTPGKFISRIVPRKKTTDLKVVEFAKINIIDYRFAKHVSSSVVFKELQYSHVTSQPVDILWELSFSFKQPVPGWQGMMHLIHQGSKHPGKSSVTFLPMIDMYSGDKTCILSTLEYLYNLAKKNHVPAVITFDQPLYWKASEIQNSSHTNSHLRDIVILLGSFHTLMNLLGAIGALMQGSGLGAILEEIYADNAVVHILSGKAVQRALRGHLLVDKCLKQMILGGLIQDDPEFCSLVEKMETVYSSVVSGEKPLEALTSMEELKRIEQTIRSAKESMAASSKTSQLWIGYQKMLETARALIKADRTGSWRMHLSAVSDCIPIYAAAGHFNYVKSAYLYLQGMNELDQKHPDIVAKFESGLHVIRRTDHFWAGLGSDLTIEQTLMRSLKTSGGLTRGSGMTEEVRTIWTLSSCVSSAYNLAMQEFTELSFTSSEQHKDSTTPRIKRDQEDRVKLLQELLHCNPFSKDSELRNVVTGVVANDDVNVHEYEAVGKAIVQKMVGQPIFTYSFKRKDKVKTLGDSSLVKVNAEQAINPELLFQRFLVVSQAGDLTLNDIMDYELSPYPPALFEAKHVFQKADKPQLAHALRDFVSQSSSNAVITDSIPESEHFVLDGGSLLHRLSWKKGITYGEIAEEYVNFTISKYGMATVVFDGYSGEPSIKDNEHQRRQRKSHPVVRFDSHTVFSSGRMEDFLSKDSNKQQMINLISGKLKDRGCEVIHAHGDADVDIVKAAVASAKLRDTTLVGEDTDILILLLYYVERDSKKLYFRSDKLKSKYVYDICSLKDLLGCEVSTQLLFVHAFTGCDSTSRIYGIGKKALFQKLIKK
jgi:hypothetical protein